ncbi:MAG: hypothetical protein CMP08_00160 [Xanthomonadales bacterium]|nr:hypothetical protein [Xanthomonadales bacterium]|tara:strand:- start:1257 stop:2048 length:792 start_codon:yes stop_codon:yes gene_type:complete
MPHLVTHRPRLSRPGSTDTRDTSNHVWQTINAYSYKLGGLCFVVGSIFFLPSLAAYIVVGDWLFFAGSLLYLLVTGHDLLEVHQYWRAHPTHTGADTIERIAAWSYVLGTLAFVVGSLCFLPSLEWISLGAVCFIAGSIAFIVGGLVNVLQVVEAPSLLYMQLFNVTVALYLIGSALFTVASIPYLWHLADPADTLITRFAAAQFVTGSLLFFAGGVVTYYRELVGHRLADWCRAGGMGTAFIHLLRDEIQDKGQIKARNTQR